MQIIVVVLISLAEWYATLGPHLFHFKSYQSTAQKVNTRDMLYSSRQKVNIWDIR